MLLRDQERIRGEEVIAVGPRGFKFRRTDGDGEVIPEMEELPALSGAWGGWAARRLDLRSVETLWIGLDQPLAGIPITNATLPVISSTPRARIMGSPALDMETDAGQEVHAVWPELEVPQGPGVPAWRYSARINGTSRQGRLSDLPETLNGRYRLDSLAAGAVVANVELKVLGPLGSDLRVTFLVVDGISINIEPARVLRPNEPATVIVRAVEGVQVDGEQGGCKRRVEPPATSLTFHIVPGTGDSQIKVRIPRLQWAIRQRDVPSAFGHDVHQLTTNDIGQQSMLLLRTQRQCQVQLRLEFNGTILQVEGPHNTAPDGRWAFPLAMFTDTIRLSLSSRLELIALIDTEIMQRVAVVHARHEISRIRVETLVDGPTVYVGAIWEENRPFHGRVLRLWPSCRPWAPPVEIPIPDEKTSEVDCLIENGSLRPGPYLAEITIADAWSAPVRPRAGSPPVLAMDVGDHTDRSAHIQTLNPADPCQYLELLLLGEGPVTTPTAEAASAVLAEILITALHLIDHDLSRIERLVPLLFRDPDRLAVELSDLAADERLDERQLLRLGILLGADACKHRLSGLNYEARNRLFQVVPIIAVATDTWPNDELARIRWYRHLGWPPEKEETRPQVSGAVVDSAMKRLRPPEPGGAIEEHWLQLARHRIEEIRSALVTLANSPLTWEGFAQAVFEWLPSARKQECTEWDGAYHHLVRELATTTLAGRYVTQLLPGDLHPGVRRFPAVLLAA